MKQSNIKDIEFDIKDGKLLLNIHKDFMIRYLSNNGDLSNEILLFESDIKDIIGENFIEIIDDDSSAWSKDYYTSSNNKIFIRLNDNSLCMFSYFVCLKFDGKYVTIYDVCFNVDEGLSDYYFLDLVSSFNKDKLFNLKFDKFMKSPSKDNGLYIKPYDLNDLCDK